jgi:hypothetical protein
MLIIRSVMRRGPRRLSRTPRGGPFRVAAALGAGAVIVTVIVSGCGSRGPLDDTSVVTLDATAEAAPVPSDATVDAPRDSGLEAGLAACGVCVLSSCSPAIIRCLESSSCLGVFQCVFTTCLALPNPSPGPSDASGDAEGGGGGGGGGGLDTGCLLGCAASDPGGVLQVLALFQCVSGTCGGACGSVLGGLGGLGGFPGLPGGGRERERAFAEIFAPWPELTSRLPRTSSP